MPHPTVSMPDARRCRVKPGTPDGILRRFGAALQDYAKQLQQISESTELDFEEILSARRVVEMAADEFAFLGMEEAARAAETMLDTLTGTEGLPPEGTRGIRAFAEWLDNVGVSIVRPRHVIDRTPDQGLRILICDDSRISQTFLAEILRTFGECTFADNGRGALEAFQKALDENNPFDLISLDILMPEMSGQEALARIRKLEDERGIQGLDGVKVIMATSIRDAKNIMRAFRVGCEAYVVKPVDRDKMTHHMRELGLID